MNTELLGSFEIIASVFLLSLKVVFFKSVKYNFINTITISIIGSIIFSILYVLYESHTTKNYFKINNATLPNPLHLVADPIQNLLNPRVIMFSILGQIRIIARYASFLFLPISVAVPLESTGMFTLLYYSHLINKTPITVMDYVASFTICLGAISLNWNKIMNNTNEAKSYSMKSYMIGIGLILFCITVYSFILIISKDMTKMLTPGQTMINNNVSGAIFGILLWMIYYFTPAKQLLSTFKTPKILPSWNQVAIAFLFFTIINSSSNLLKYFGMELLPDANYGILLNSDVIFSLILGKLFFNEDITFTKILGVIIILIAVLMISLQDNKRIDLLFSHLEV